MKNEKFDYREEIYDENDSVFYGKGKQKKYWNTETQKYTAFENKKNTSIWTDTNYYDLMDGKWADMGRLLQLMKYCDSDNMLCIYDAHQKTMKPISTEKQFMDLLELKQRAWHAFKTKLDSANIIKYITIEDGNGRKNMRYFINPLVTMRTRAISTMCYKLFQEDLDKVLTPRAIKNLRRHCAEEVAQPTDPVDEIAASSDADKQAIFDEYILQDQPAQTYQPVPYTDKDGKLKYNYKALPLTADNDTYFLVNGQDEYKVSKPAKGDITCFRAWYLDIDAGKDGDKHYFDLKEVAKRKAAMMEVVNVLPTPTAIVNTRNGYHVYYACYGIEDADVWQQLQDNLIQTAIIADPACRDASRLLRLPGSMWIKAHIGLAPYPVSIVAANRQAYDADSFSSQLDQCADKVAAAAEKYLVKYPMLVAKKSRTAAASMRGDQTPRINAIADLSTDTFTLSINTETIDDINTYLKQVNLAEFLQIENPSSFNCILHDDRNPSATIYANETGYRYYCASDCVGHGDGGHGIDIIDIVQILSGCSYKQAINYLCRLYGVRQQSAA